MTNLRAVILSVVLALGAFVAGPLAASQAATTKQTFEKSLDAVMAAENGPPGISVQITRNGKAEYFSRGIGNLKSGNAPKLKEHFRIASVAKAFSGGVALSLVAQGKLKLNDTIGKILPGVMPKAKKVTLAQALHHTGGLPDYIRDKKFIKVLTSDPGQYLPPKKLISFVKNKKLTSKPGKKYAYSDTDNIIVGLMAEKVTGIPYTKLLKRQIYKRLGLTQTSLPRTLNMPTPFLRGYEIEAGKAPEDVTKFINPSLAWASGGIVSTLPDLSKFFRGYVPGALFGNKIRKAQRSWVKGSSSPPGPGSNAAGLAVFKYTSKCGTVYGHTGSFPGYRIFAASSANGLASITYVANAQITEGPVSDLIRKSQVEAVCHALG